MASASGCYFQGRKDLFAGLEIDGLEKDWYEGRRDLFEGLDIWEDEKYRELQGTYPVIFLSFAGIKGNTFEVTQQQICIKISDIYEENRYLLDGDILSEIDG